MELKINYRNINSSRTIGIILTIIGIFMGLIALGSLMNGDILIGVVFIVITMFFAGYSITKLGASKNAQKYIQLLENDEVEIKELAVKLMKTEDDVLDEIEELISSGVLLNIYIDKVQKEVKEISYSKDKNKKIKKTELANCSGCGAEINLKIGECEFCGKKI